MKITGSKYPVRVELLKTDGRFSTLALRRNIQPTNEVDALTGTSLFLYEYEQVKIRIKNRRNLVKYVEAGFDRWFENGLRLEKLQAEITEKEKEMKDLIDGMGQVQVNENLEISDEILFEGVAETFEEVEVVSKVSNIALEGITDVYELLDEILMSMEEGEV